MLAFFISISYELANNFSFEGYSSYIYLDDFGFVENSTIIVDLFSINSLDPSKNGSFSLKLYHNDDIDEIFRNFSIIDDCKEDGKAI